MDNNLRDPNKKDFLEGYDHVESDISWMHGTNLIPRDGSFGNIPLESLHECADAFKDEYPKVNFKEFIKCDFWTDLVALLVLGTSQG